MEALGRNSRLLGETSPLDLENSAAFGINSVPAEEDSTPSHRLVPLLAWVAVVFTLVLIPFRIISMGYLPPDDALRHAAKAVSGRDWSEMLVLQDQFKVDHNPGWHWILGRVHQLTGAGTDGLVTLSVCGLVCLVCLLPLIWIRRPESWLSALLAGTVLFPLFMVRLFLGRPFAVTIGATLAVLLLWQNRKSFPPKLLAGTTALFAVAAWLHGSWYLFALVVVAFAFAGQRQAAVRLLGCWLAGSFAAGLLTGHPISFLWNAINIAINCFSQNQLERMLVLEFRPLDGDPFALFTIFALLALRAATGTWNWNCVRNPTFLLVVFGWVLSLRVSRFWADWGLPALVLWAALELQKHFERYLPLFSVRRLMITGGLCAALFFGMTADLGSRWTRNLFTEYLTESDPEAKEWLPDDNGILYSAEMGVFYNTIFKNPYGKWKYILGFEATFMPPEDLKVYRAIQWNFYATRSYDPWVAKMRPEDRLVIINSSPTAPDISALEWKRVVRDTWVGRLPRKPREKKS